MWLSIVMLCGYLDGSKQCRYMPVVTYEEQATCRDDLPLRIRILIAKNRAVLDIGGGLADCTFVEVGDEPV